MSSDEEYRNSNYEVKMEDVIVQQNSDLLALHEHLEFKDRELTELRNELHCQKTVSEQLDDSISKQNNIIHILKTDLKNKDADIDEMRNEIISLKQALDEAIDGKLSLLNRLENLEEVVREKNSAVKERDDWLLKLQEELKLAKLAAEHEIQARIDLESESNKLKKEFSDELKLVSEKCGLIVAVQDHQIELLLNRIKQYPEKSLLDDEHFETCRKKYEDNINELKHKISQVQEDFLSQSFINEIKDLSLALPDWLSLEASLKLELKSQSEKLKKRDDELLKTEHICAELKEREKQLEINLNILESELNNIREEKLQLQRLLGEANDKYEKMTIAINREQSNWEKNIQKSIDSYESDVNILVKSLHTLLSYIPQYFNFHGGEDSTSANPDVHAADIDLILNTNVCKAHQLVNKCFCELEKCSFIFKQISKESRELQVALESQKKTLDEKTERLNVALGELVSSKKQCEFLQDNKTCMEYDVLFVMEENRSANQNIELLNSQIVDLKQGVKNYQDEICSLKEEIKGLKNKDKEEVVPAECPKCFKDQKLEKDWENDVSNEEIYWASPKHPVTSTPLHVSSFVPDPKGAGDINSFHNIHSSVVKWMEKCQELDGEKKVLMNKISNLEIYNQDLKFTINTVREEMDIFQERQSTLEKKLSSFISLKKHCNALTEEIESKDVSLKRMENEIKSLIEKQNELIEKNIQLEESHKQNLNKLNSVMNNESGFSNGAMKAFNEKVRELICLKQEVCVKEKNMRDLSIKVDFLIESNNSYVEKLQKECTKVYVLQEELEKALEEKLELFSSNKLLRKEIDLLGLRVEYLSNLREKMSGSKKLVQEIQADLVGMLQCSSKLSGNQDENTPAKQDLHEIIDALNKQVQGEQLDFIEKVKDLQKVIDAAREQGTLNEDWLLGVDRMCRSIVEDNKYHTLQYSRLEEALSSLLKSQPLTNKCVGEDSIDSFKIVLEQEALKEQLEEKDSTIKMLLNQKESLEKEMEEQQLSLSAMEVKYVRMRRDVERDYNLAMLQSTRKQVEDKLASLEWTDGYRDALRNARLEAEVEYLKAIEQVRASFEEDSASRLVHQQQLHLEQVKQLEKLIEEQAIQISLFLEEGINFTDHIQTKPGLLFRMDELRKELTHVLSGVRLAHKVELELVHLEHSKTQSLSNILTPLTEANENCAEKDPKSLMVELESILRHYYSSKLKKFLAAWHPSYSKRVLEIESLLKSRMVESEKELSCPDKLEEHFNDNSRSKEIFSLTENFLDKLKNEYKTVINKLEEFVSKNVDAIENSFEKIREVHFDRNEILKIHDVVLTLKEDKKQLELSHRKAVECVRERVSTLVDLVERSVEGEFSASLQTRLQEEHRLELDHLRDYYVQMCSNMEKQYTEDVNSLQSKLASLSGSELSSLDVPPIMLSEAESEKDWSIQHCNSDQMKFLEDLERKWSDEINELKACLKNKYSKIMKDVHQVLSTYIYKSELDMCARCLKEEVMRDCQAEIETINEELLSRVLKYHQKARHLSSGRCEEVLPEIELPQVDDFVHQRLLKDQAGNGKPLSEKNYIKNMIEFQTTYISSLNHIFSTMDSTLSNMDNKLKDKECKLISIQNKLNCISQFFLRNFNKYHEIKLFESNMSLIQVFEDKLINNKFLPTELERIQTLILKNNGDIKCRTCQEVKLSENMSEIKPNLDFSHDDRYSQKLYTSEEYNRLVLERDSLKQMTSTLKSAVSQLVLFLNTCEDELNRTVVEELVKICEETPVKDSETENLRRVHFAPHVEESFLDESQDLSLTLRVQLDSCLAKLKMEAASLLELTTLHQPPANINKQIENLCKENDELLKEISQIKLQIGKCQNCHTHLGEEIFRSDLFENGPSLLSDQVQVLLSGSESSSPNSAKMLDDLAKFGDKVIMELRKDKLDLQQQIVAADKQLKSTRKFLEEQAQDRENERDDYSKEVKYLQEQLKETKRHFYSQERFSVQLQHLETQLMETKGLLEETEKGKELADCELKDAIAKIRELREIIYDLEAQLSRKSEKEELLEQQLDRLKAELDHHSDTHIAMAQELESLRGQSMEDSYLEEIKQLHENIKVQFDSSVVRNIKTQIHEMELSLERRTKELENLCFTYSSHSLSSPSEEISVVEQFEANQTKSPEESPSPVALPVHEISCLQEKLNRHATVEQVSIKRFRDLQLTCSKLNIQLEELQTERDVIQQQLKKQMGQLAKANNKIDELRHKVEVAQTAANKDLVLEIQEIKQKNLILENTLESLQTEVSEQRAQLSHAEEIIDKQQTEMQKAANSHHRLVESLRSNLGTVTKEKKRLENLMIKQKEETHFDMMNALLDDKNEDIEQLQQTVMHLKNQEVKGIMSSSNSKKHKVSFTSEIQDDSFKSDDMRLRDASHRQSLNFEQRKYPSNDLSRSPLLYDKLPVDLDSPSKGSCPSLLTTSESHESSIEVNVDNLLKQLKLESDEKSHQIAALEKEVDYLKSVQDDLKSTKSELEGVLASVSHDKGYYENQLMSLNEDIKTKSEEIKSLKLQILNKDEEIVKKKSDVKVLEEISVNLQNKLREATDIAEQGDSKLSVEIVQREREVENLKHELNACMNDLSDEKELSETLKSSLNILTREKVQLEEKLSLFEIENINLSKALHAANGKLDQYATTVRNLKNYLVSKCSDEVFQNSNSLLDNNNYEDLFQLKEEVTKMVDLNDQLNSQHLMFTREIEELKRNLFFDSKKGNDMTVKQLKEELCDLKNVVGQIKEEKMIVFSNFSSEIEQLNKDIVSLKESKRTLMEKLRNELSEKQQLHQMYTDLHREMENNENSMDKQGVGIKKKELSFCDINVLNIPPTNSLSSLDVLAEKMRNEMQLSKSLDNSLLDAFQVDEDRVMKKSPKLALSSEAYEKALCEEVKRCEDVKKSLNVKIDLCQNLETENNQLKVDMGRLQRLASSLNEKVNQLSSQIDFQKEKIINLELTILREQSNVKQVSLLLEHEKNKGRETQKEDIGLIEAMRQRLQNLMENEIKLKRLLLDEKTKSDQLLAQINSARALEKFQLDLNNAKNNSSFSEEEKRKYLSLKIEYEREKQNREDLKCVLTRERALISLLEGKLKSSEQAHRELEKESTHVRKKLSEEVVRRQIAESKLIELQENFDSRFQKYTRNSEEKQQKELDAAYAVIGELEREHSSLMRKQGEMKLGWRERLMTYQETVADLEADRERLIKTVTFLRERLLERAELVEGTRAMRLDDRAEVMKHEGDRVLNEMETLFRNMVISERQRKALVFQKQYLLVTLRSQHSYRLRLAPTRPRRTLRTVVWVVVAAIKLHRLPSARFLRFLKKKNSVLDRLKKVLVSPEVERLTLPSQPESVRAIPHSPPSKDFKFP